jgi:hypothetical protein
MEHSSLAEEQRVRLRALVPSNATHHEWSIDSASKLETDPNEWTLESYALVVTYKVGPTGDIPVTNVLIKDWSPTKHVKLEKEQKVRLRALVPSNAIYHEWSIDSASKLETKTNKWTLESYALVVTYKVGTTGDIPVTNVLIKGWGRMEHSSLAEEQRVRLRALVPSNATHHEWSIDSASKLETEQNEWMFESYALLVTYKVGPTGDVPATNVLIKGWVITKHILLKEEEKGWLRALVGNRAKRVNVWVLRFGRDLQSWCHWRHPSHQSLD